MVTLLSILIAYLFVWIFYLSFFAVAGLFYRNGEKSHSPSNRAYAVLIPAYKEDAVIVNSVSQNLNNLSELDCSIYVIADSLKVSTVLQLLDLGVQVIKVDFEFSTKAKALNEALNYINADDFTHVVVLDADNVVDPDFAPQLDQYSDSLLRAAQTHRRAKNSNSATAILDGLNEEIGNHIFRKGHTAVNLSSALIGSGMVFEYNLFHSIMKNVSDTAAEDKVMEFDLLSRNIKVSYLDDVVVYDEKVSSLEQFEGQRQRWVAARYFFLVNYARHALVSLIKGEVDYFNKWLQFLLPQKSLLISLSIFASICSMFFDQLQVYGIALFSLTSVMLLMSIPKSMINLQLLKSVIHFPLVLLRMLKILLSVRKIDPTRFNVTPKGLAE